MNQMSTATTIAIAKLVVMVLSHGCQPPPRNILIVDDDTGLRGCIADYLVGEGYEVSADRFGTGGIPGGVLSTMDKCGGVVIG